MSRKWIWLLIGVHSGLFTASEVANIFLHHSFIYRLLRSVAR
jgi:hypothetical protein